MRRNPGACTANIVVGVAPAIPDLLDIPPDIGLINRKDTHRMPKDDDIIDRIAQLSPQRKLLSHGQIDPSGCWLRSNAQGVALHVLLPTPFKDWVALGAASTTDARVHDPVRASGPGGSASWPRGRCCRARGVWSTGRLRKASRCTSVAEDDCHFVVRAVAGTVREVDDYASAGVFHHDHVTTFLLDHPGCREIDRAVQELGRTLILERG